MPLPALFAPVFTWVFREVVVKFFIFTGLFLLIGFLVPKVVSLISPWIGVGSLSSAFSGLPRGVWFFLDFFQLGYGAPLMISAFVTRFLIRRMPVIG